MGGGRIQPEAVHNDVPIVANLNCLSAKSHETLDVVCVLLKSRNAVRGENNNFTAPWPPKIVSNAIHKQAVSARDLEAHNVLTFSVISFEFDSPTRGELFGKHLFGRKPDRVLAGSDLKALPLYKW